MAINLTIPQFVNSLRYANAASPTAAEVAKRGRFLEKYPAQEANVLSFQANPACQCARDIAQAISSDPNKIENLSYIWGDTVNLVTPVNMFGKIITIADTPEAWLALTQRFQTEMFQFRGLTIVPANGELKVFFY